MSFLGFDLSTQQLKAVLINDDLSVAFLDFIHFDTDLPEFNTTNGFHVDSDDDKVVTTPTLLWVKAFDLILDRLRKNVDVSKVRSISGSAQQHGTVYWAKEDCLRTLDSKKSLGEQLLDAFTFQDSPIWMDSSTTKYCDQVEKIIGGAEKVANITGSRATERYPGMQFAKRLHEHTELFNDTEHISLVSSFGASLFLGSYAPMDQADASGSNLLNIRTKQWDDEMILSICSSEDYFESLKKKLPKVVPATTNLGRISSYFVDRYGFSPDCSVVAWTGDNPSSLAGLCLKEGDIALSLGTSDCLFIYMADCFTSADTATFINPVDPDAYMGMIVFKNGSLAREAIRDKYADGSWDKFNSMLESTLPGNNGLIGAYFHATALIPRGLVGEFRWGADDVPICDKHFATPANDVRAVVEGQCLARRTHAERLMPSSTKCRIIATGGASTNPAILQVYADVFGADVYTIGETSNSAALGAAYRAKHGSLVEETPYHKVVANASAANPVLAANPRPDNTTGVYCNMLARYKRLEASLCK